MGLIPKTGEQHLTENNNINHGNKPTKQKNSNNISNTIDYKNDYTINNNNISITKKNKQKQSNKTTKS